MILAIDDDPELLAGLRRALSSSGIPIFTTEDADQAFAILASQPVDVVISDIDMPAMNGLELVRRIRIQYPDVVRILLTGFGTFDAARRAINEGEVHRFLSKPFDPGELKRILAEAIDRRTELARSTQAALQGERRRALLQQLEHEHPGISRMVRDPNGRYLVSGSRASAAERALGILAAAAYRGSASA
jgi:YesN/AraC family two-component response regulator